MDLVLVIQILIWALGGWITGLLIRSAGIRLRGGSIFLMLLGWGIAGILGMIGWAYFSEGNFYEEFQSALFYGLILGAVGGLVTIRQLAKARKNAS